MYTELGRFIRDVAPDRKLWTDGEFPTAIFVGAATGLWCRFDTTAIPAIRAHLGELVKVEAIVFGFVLTTLFFYVGASASWADDPRVSRVAERLVNWHVWTILCLLALLGYVVVLWAFGERIVLHWGLKPVAYGMVGFLASYCAFQIMNHVLTIRWAFRRRHDLRVGPPPKAGDAIDADQPRQDHGHGQ